MNYEALIQYIRPELFVLIVVLYCIGNALKNVTFIMDELIPFILGVISIFLCAIYVLAVDPIEGGYQNVLIAIFNIIIQGVCCAAAAVYVHQLHKQHDKLENIIQEKSNDSENDFKGSGDSL